MPAATDAPAGPVASVGSPPALAPLVTAAGRLAREAGWLADARVLRTLKAVRRVLKTDPRPCPDNPRRRPYGEIMWAPKPWWCARLYRMVRAERPARVLELGTSVGLTALYLGAALERNRHGHLWTVEALPAKAAYAADLFAAFAGGRISGLRGFSQDVLPGLLAADPFFDWAFVDIDHRYQSTVDHLALLRDHIRPGGWLLFDDITLNDDMRRAWTEIRTDPAFDWSTLHWHDRTDQPPRIGIGRRR